MAVMGSTFIRQHWKVLVSIFGLLIIIAAGLIVHQALQSPIPAKIRKQVSFPILLPKKQDAVINNSSYKFDSDQKVFSFTAYLMSDHQLATFTEQATPSPFLDIPNFYPQFLQTLHEYQSFDGLQGTVYLTHPKGVGQAAILNSKGTLMFIRVPHDEPQSTWQPLTNHLKTIDN
jgi:hypothetical protein